MRPNNPNYLVEIKRHGETARSLEQTPQQGSPQRGNNQQPEQDNVVIAYLPQTFSFQIQSDWEPAIANAIEGAIGETGSRAMAAGRALGWKLSDKILTAQIWRSTEPLDISLTLLFDAINDTRRDVINPIKRLIKWSVPGRMGGNGEVGGSVLESPGPSLQNFLSNPDNKRTSLRIGRMFYFDNVIIPSVGVNFVTAPDLEGKFIGAEVDITFRTFFTPDVNDIMRYFIEGDPDERFNEFNALKEGRGELLQRLLRFGSPQQNNPAPSPGPAPASPPASGGGNTVGGGTVST